MMHSLRIGVWGLTIAFLAGLSYAQWEHTYLPYRIKINSIAVSGSNVFAGYDGGLFRSSDSGISWQSAPLPKLWASQYIMSNIVVRGSKVFAEESARFLIKSADYGFTFEDGKQLFIGLSQNTDYMFANSDNGVYRKRDNIDTWERAPDTGLADTNVLFLGANKVVVLAATKDSGVFMSLDNATHWIRAGSGLPRDSLGKYRAVNALCTPDSSSAFCLSDSGIYYLSAIDPQVVWVKISAGLPKTTVNCVTKIADNTAKAYIFAGTLNGLYRTSDNGVTWEPADSGLKTESIDDTVKVFTFACQGTKIYAGTGSGVYFSTNFGSTWIAINCHANITSLKTGNNTLFAGTPIGMYISKDDGNTWEFSKNGPKKIRALATKSDTIFALTSDGSIANSYDFGNNWRWYTFDFPYEFSVIAAKENCVFLGTRQGWAGIYQSCNNDNFWRETDSGLLPLGKETDNIHVFCIGLADNSLFVSSSTMYNDFTGLFRSSSGKNWIKSDTGIIGQVYTFTANSSACFAGTYSNGVFRSVDKGRNWVQTNYRQNLVDLASTEQYIIAGDKSGVCASGNNGSTWAAINKGLTNLNVTAVTANATHIFAATAGSGVYRMRISDLASLSVFHNANNRPGSALPLKIATEHHFLRITLSLLAKGRVRIKLYTITGRNYAFLTDNDIPVGESTITLNTTKFPSGCYTLRVRGPGICESVLFVNTK